MSQVLAKRLNSTESKAKRVKFVICFPTQSLIVRKSKVIKNIDNSFFPKYPLKSKQGWSNKNPSYIFKARNKFKKNIYDLSQSFHYEDKQNKIEYNSKIDAMTTNQIMIMI